MLEWLLALYDLEGAWDIYSLWVYLGSNHIRGSNLYLILDIGQRLIKDNGLLYFWLSKDAEKANNWLLEGLDLLADRINTL
jgi:hypothetical protein